MERTRRFLRERGLPDREPGELPTSAKRFPDGAQYRVEIPSVEGPIAYDAVVQACAEFSVIVHRISQGSGIMLLTDEEIRAMAGLGAAQGQEVSLFVGPRGTFDINAGPLTAAGKNLGWRLRGMDQLVYAVEDVRRACSLGIRSVLVADEGLLWLLRDLRAAGDLPADPALKVSVLMGAANPLSIRLMEEWGATTYNVPSDMTLAQIAAVRAAVDMPLDIYVEVPDDFGGFIRLYDIPEIVRIAAPAPDSIGGRGLLIVEQFSQGWGVTRHDQGKTVWAELALAHR